MRFWIGWELWQKLSVVLGILIALVLIFAFCVLAYNRWTMRKFSAAEARQKEEEAELHPILTKDDIPFGARALERGIQVEGIWISNHNTPAPSPHQPGTPAGSRPVSPAPRLLIVPPTSPAPTIAHNSAMTTPTSLPSHARPEGGSELDIGSANHANEPHTSEVYTPAIVSNIPGSPSTPHRKNDALIGSEKRASFHSRILRPSHYFDTKNTKTVLADPNELDPESATNGTDSRSQVEQNKASRIARTLRRRSSEEFRRKMSQIFNDNIRMGVPDESLQFDPILHGDQRRSKRKSILGPFRS